jgi:hypothetical protein
VDLAYLCRIEDGAAHPSIDILAKLALPLGVDLSARFYPNTGPVIRDRHQARILEALLAQLHPRWRSYLEVGVRHPSRGWIDVLIHAHREGTVVATEVASALPRIEQLLRWFQEKVAALPSWEGWGQIESADEPSRLLIVRSTKATRTIGRQFERQLATAYPAHPADAIASLTGTAPWPGPALIWAEIEATRVRFIARR